MHNISISSSISDIEDGVFLFESIISISLISFSSGMLIFLVLAMSINMGFHILYFNSKVSSWVTKDELSSKIPSFDSSGVWNWSVALNSLTCFSSTFCALEVFVSGVTGSWFASIKLVEKIYWNKNNLLNCICCYYCFIIYNFIVNYIMNALK